MTTPNAELAYKVLDHIDAHPEQWNQGIYIDRAECGTVACFAGWAVLLSGAEPRYYGNFSTNTVTVEAHPVLVSDHAEAVLRASRFVTRDIEFDEDDFEWDLFDGSNSRATLGELVEEIFGLRPDRQ